MRTVQSGDYVKLCYTGKLDNGVVFDQTGKCNPLEVQVGSGSLVQGFEDALIGMNMNEPKSFVLGPEEAYGERDEQLERTFPRSELPPDFSPTPGQTVLFLSESGQKMPAVVKHVDADTLIADFNHPLAGKTLSFEVEVSEINDAPSELTAQCGSGCCCSS